ncbi:unnamed protein product [Porites evermanni]|uniref:Neurotransmitter-gated ion-channel ligand-binding domain-containing protein n=1 Tax=Porites evermanni TaxID=104178 RepID=A0ABN8M4H2_9CNID|nr:unnamed protein product [Porites evermanni]
MKNYLKKRQILPTNNRSKAVVVTFDMAFSQLLTLDKSGNMQAFVLSRDLFFVTLFVYTTVLLCGRDKRVGWPAAEISDAQTAKLQAGHPTFSYKQGDVMRKYGMSRTAWLIECIRFGIFTVLVSLNVTFPAVFKNQFWTNNRLSWDPDEFEGITLINVSPKIVWKPDILLYNKLHVNVSETNAIKILSKWAGHLYVIISKYGFEQKRFHPISGTLEKTLYHLVLRNTNVNGLYEIPKHYLAHYLQKDINWIRPQIVSLSTGFKIFRVNSFFLPLIFKVYYVSANEYDWFSARLLLKRQNNIIEIMKMIETFPAAAAVIFYQYRLIPLIKVLFKFVRRQPLKKHDSPIIFIQLNRSFFPPSLFSTNSFLPVVFLLRVIKNYILKIASNIRGHTFDKQILHRHFV